jgi:hypothetical protein
MFEIYGREKTKYDGVMLRKIHLLNGIVYIVLYVFVAYFCLSYIFLSKAEFTPRGTFHSIFAMSIIVLLFLKILFVRVYKKYYFLTKTFVVLIALLTFGLVGTSAGYYFLVTEFGKDRTFEKIMEYKKNLHIEREESYWMVLRSAYRPILRALAKGRIYLMQNASSVMPHTVTRRL